MMDCESAHSLTRQGLDSQKGSCQSNASSEIISNFVENSFKVIIDHKAIERYTTH